MVARNEAGSIAMFPLFLSLLHRVAAGSCIRRNLILENFALRHPLLVLNHTVSLSR